MSSKHTKGPWTIGEYFEETKTTTFTGPYVDILTENRRGQPVIVAGRTEEETRANAHLVSSAPELLDACKGIEFLAVAKAPSGVDQAAWEEAFSRIAKAITKAEGRRGHSHRDWLKAIPEKETR